jgi:integrase
METWWLPEFGSTRLRAITHVMLTRHLAKIGKRRDPYLADATLHRILSPMSALLTRAAKEGVVDHNVCRDVEVPKRDHIERFDSDADDDDEREVTYTRAEMRALLAVLVGQPTLHLLVHLLSVTGLRISEALPLRWRDLVLDGPEPHVKVRRAWVRQRMGPPKSKYGRRNVPIPRALVDELRQQRRRLDPRQELVLPSDTGTVRLPENVRRLLLPFAQEAGMEWHGFHGFRRAFGSMLIAEGRNVLQVSRLMGHHSPAFTLAVYIKELDEGTGGPLGVDLTPAPTMLEAAVEHALREEERAA